MSKTNVVLNCVSIILADFVVLWAICMRLRELLGLDMITFTAWFIKSLMED